MINRRILPRIPEEGSVGASGDLTPLSYVGAALVGEREVLFEGRILFQGTPEELAENKTVKEKYLTTSFVLRKKDFQLLDEQKKARDKE